MMRTGEPTAPPVNTPPNVSSNAPTEPAGPSPAAAASAAAHAAVHDVGVGSGANAAEREARQSIQAPSGGAPKLDAPAAKTHAAQMAAVARTREVQAVGGERPAGLPMQLAEALFGFPGGMKAAAVMPRAEGTAISTIGSQHQIVRISGGDELNGYPQAVARDRARLERLYELGFDSLYVMTEGERRYWELDIAKAIGRPEHPEPQERFNDGLLQIIGNQMAYRVKGMSKERRAAFEAHESRDFGFVIGGEDGGRLTLEMSDTEIGLGNHYRERFESDRRVMGDLRGYGFKEFVYNDYNSSWIYRVR